MMDRLNEGTDAGEILRMMKALTITTLLAFLIPQAYVQAEPVIEPQPKYEITYLEPLEAPELARVEHAVQIAVPKPKPQQTAPKTVISGNKYDWLKAAGIPESDWQFADYIVSRESSWNPNAINKSSGACSLAQSLPCSKIKGNWRDPVVALKWQYNYVLSRYGSYAKAYSFWVANNWY